MDIPVRVVGQYHIVAKVDELIPRLPGLIRAGNGPEHEESESLAATLVRANLRRMAMDGLDYWRLCDEVNVIQAALLIVGRDPSSDASYVEDWQPENRPTGYEA